MNTTLVILCIDFRMSEEPPKDVEAGSKRGSLQPELDALRKKKISFAGVVKTTMVMA